MAGPFSRKQAQVEAEKPVTANSLIASAVQISYDNLLSWTAYQFGRDEGWQRELWRLYDIVGEFRFASNWVGSMCGRVRIYVAEVDERGVLGPETTDPEISALADNMLGGPAAKAEALRLMGINLTVAGELFVVGKAGRNGDADKWYVVTPSELTRWRGGVYYNGAEGPVQLVDKTDMIIRVWTPHPRRVFLADSPAHGAMNIITEIERLTKFVFSQIDSRLAGAGILFIPTGMDFPDNDDGMGAADSIMAKLTEAGAASLKGEGSAAGIIPIVAEVPQEALGKIQLVRFDSVLSEQAESLRDEAIKRFAYSMDFPPEVITGQGSSNHWSAWYVDENAIKVHVEPLMSRICDALTTATLVPSLKQLGKDPKRFTYWYDTSGLTARPTRLEDALKLNGAQLLSGEAAVEAGFFREDEMMSVEERNRILGWQAVLRDPTLLQNDDFRIMIGIPESVIPKGALLPPAPVLPPPPPVPPKTVVQPGRQPMPDTQGQIPSQQPKSTALAASAAQSSTLALVATSELAARRAMELAGGRMLKGRHDRFPDIPKWELNTQFANQDDATITKLLAGAWTHVAIIASIIDTVDADELTRVLNDYCSDLLRTSTAHQPDALLDALRTAGMVDG